MLLDRSVEMLSVEFAESVPISSSEEQHKHKLNQEVLKNSNVTEYKWDIVWKNIVIFSIIHLISVYGVWLMMTQIMWRTFIFFNVYASITFFGITAGTHRLWTHKSYKAKLPLRIFLMLSQTGAYLNHIYEWVRDHRVHHKYADTDADPHNARRGFFFSHLGWVMVRKHKDVITKGKVIDLSDLKADPVVMFQKRYYAPLVLLLCFIIPAIIPYYCWGEDYWMSWIVCITRFTYVMNSAALVNSLAHAYGDRPYDKFIQPSENKFVSWIAYGEGWHNYHHAFPWDYKTSELGNYKFNVTTAFIDLMAKLGQAYDLKTVSPEMIRMRAQRTGDGSWKGDSGSSIANGTIGRNHHDAQNDNVWGWDDMDPRDMKYAKVYYKSSE